MFAPRNRGCRPVRLNVCVLAMPHVCKTIFIFKIFNLSILSIFLILFLTYLISPAPQLFECSIPFAGVDPVEAARNAALLGVRPNFPPRNKLSGVEVRVCACVSYIVRSAWRTGACREAGSGIQMKDASVFLLITNTVLLIASN